MQRPVAIVQRGDEKEDERKEPSERIVSPFIDPSCASSRLLYTKIRHDLAPSQELLRGF